MQSVIRLSSRIRSYIYSRDQMHKLSQRQKYAVYRVTIAVELDPLPQLGMNGYRKPCITHLHINTV